MIFTQYISKSLDAGGQIADISKDWYGHISKTLVKLLMIAISPQFSFKVGWFFSCTGKSLVTFQHLGIEISKVLDISAIVLLITNRYIFEFSPSLLPLLCPYLYDRKQYVSLVAYQLVMFFPKLDVA